jgi:hypothetical protein
VRGAKDGTRTWCRSAKPSARSAGVWTAPAVIPHPGTSAPAFHLCPTCGNLQIDAPVSTTKSSPSARWVAPRDRCMVSAQVQALRRGATKSSPTPTTVRTRRCRGIMNSLHHRFAFRQALLHGAARKRLQGHPGRGRAGKRGQHAVRSQQRHHVTRITTSQRNSDRIAGRGPSREYLISSRLGIGRTHRRTHQTLRCDCGGTYHGLDECALPVTLGRRPSMAERTPICATISCWGCSFMRSAGTGTPRP